MASEDENAKAGEHMHGLKNKHDYSLYKCPYAHLKKEVGHTLHGPEGYEDTYSVWCQCGFRGPVFYLEPDDLGLEFLEKS